MRFYLKYSLAFGLLVTLLIACKKDSSNDSNPVNLDNLHTPLLKTPLNNYSLVNISSANLSFEWDNQYNIHHYEFFIAKDSLFDSIVYSKSLYEYYLSTEVV